MIDVQDIFCDEKDSIQIHKDIKNLLLRYNSDLRSWYRFYNSKQHDDLEETFALTNKFFWKLLRDTRILNPKSSLASINRLILAGTKNNFSITTARDAIRTKLHIQRSKMNFELVIISIGEYLRNNVGSRDTYQKLIDAADFEAYESPKDNHSYFTESRFDIHDENRILLYRQFVDALIRVAYLRYGGGSNFGESLEKVFLKIKNFLNTKQKKTKHAQDDDVVIQKLKIIPETANSRFQTVFDALCYSNQSNHFDTIDRTVTVQ
jgi:hypothetical protein